MKCKWCGSEYQTERKNTRYCSDECRKASEKKAKKETERRYQERKLEKARKRLKLDADRLSISDVNALARAEGLTYGKYLAKHGMY
jgi:ribosomal protein L20